MKKDLGGKKLDILINNAAQTIERPIVYYSHLIEKERRKLGVASTSSFEETRALVTTPQYLSDLQVELNQHLKTSPGTLYDFPNAFDKWGERLDLRGEHTWNTKLEDTKSDEILKVHIVNNISPTLLVSQLLDHMKVRREDLSNSYIINVTSNEGSFQTQDKFGDHVQNDTSKAALNMLTKSYSHHCAAYISSHIFFLSA